jgi:uncharacterized RDD family membrane protein YckC
MSHTYEYAGFWIRFLASIIDSIILIVALIPIMMIIESIIDARKRIQKPAYSYVCDIFPSHFISIRINIYT